MDSADIYVRRKEEALKNQNTIHRKTDVCTKRQQSFCTVVFRKLWQSSVCEDTWCCHHCETFKPLEITVTWIQVPVFDICCHCQIYSLIMIDCNIFNPWSVFSIAQIKCLTALWLCLQISSAEITYDKEMFAPAIHRCALMIYNQPMFFSVTSAERAELWCLSLSALFASDSCW